MLDYHFLQWSWSQRFILVSYIASFYFIITKPYARISNELIQKDFKGAFNLFCYATVICLLISCLRCFGYYKIKCLNFIYGTFGCVGANVFFLLIGFTKDKRIPTGYFFMGILCILVTCAFILYDVANYKYEER